MHTTLFSPIALLLLAATAFSGDETSGPAGDLERTVADQDERIRRLEAELERMRTSDRRGDDRPLLEREIDAYLDEVGGAGSQGDAGGPRVRLGGYFSLEFRDDGDDSTMEFDQHRLVIKIAADVADAITFETEIEIEGGGADVGFLDGNEILVEWAELGFEIVEDVLVFKAGVIFMPWGRFNQYHDDPLNDLTDRPIVSRRLGAVAFGQSGVAAEGTVEPVSDWFIDYKIALTQGFDEDITTSGGARGGRQSLRSDNNDNKTVWLRVVLDVPAGDLLDLLEVGGSGVYGKFDDAGRLSYYGYALELFARRGPFELTAEYMNLRFEQEVAAPPENPRRMDGWYVEGAWHVFPEGWRGRHALFTAESTFTFVIRIEGLDTNHSTEGTAFRDGLTQVTAGFNFRPVERAVFKVSYTWVDSDQAGFEDGSADRFTLSWASYF